MDQIEELINQVRAFAQARDWERFHTPKNLAMALVGEAGELAAELQWLTDDEVTRALAAEAEPLRLRLDDEVADVMLYLLRFADVCGIDLVAAAREKIERNEQRYPVERTRGTAVKYNASGPAPA